MSSKHKDFLSWDDDIDLDLVLGDYTDDEANNKSQASTKELCYICPVCGAEYKSVSGFRGHVMKKHQQNLRGNKYWMHFLVLHFAYKPNKKQERFSCFSSSIYIYIYSCFIRFIIIYISNNQ